MPPASSTGAASAKFGTCASVQYRKRPTSLREKRNVPIRRLDIVVGERDAPGAPRRDGTLGTQARVRPRLRKQPRRDRHEHQRKDAKEARRKAAQALGLGRPRRVPHEVAGEEDAIRPETRRSRKTHRCERAPCRAMRFVARAKHPKAEQRQDGKEGLGRRCRQRRRARRRDDRKERSRPRDLWRAPCAHDLVQEQRARPRRDVGEHGRDGHRRRRVPRRARVPQPTYIPPQPQHTDNPRLECERLLGRVAMRSGPDKVHGIPADEWRGPHVPLPRARAQRMLYNLPRGIKCLLALRRAPQQRDAHPPPARRDAREVHGGGC